ncbi:phage virion morphogenesis protein [Silvimonas sp.]|uniref:phage virion morphogenesis protein n=1 Tax=Silvimonas sp. TaxID=2650811 RepID=UPI00284E078C|nr:phage virion morphogenesis protein [Silvimonas sp.]MDR3429682.1 phage virion morphogenesis protein [Silvimonas sp.]
MSDDFDQLQDWASDLLTRLQPVERRKLTRQIATQLRKSQAKRIAEQLNPDGTAYAPRANRLRKKQGRIKRTMFNRLRTARHLKAESDASEARVGFSGRDARIAQQHQEGSAPRLPRRQLLGFVQAERESIKSKLIEILSK